MFNTRNELLNLISMVSMTLVFLDPDGTIAQADMLDHNNLYMGFDVGQSVVTGTFGRQVSMIYEDDDELEEF